MSATAAARWGQVLDIVASVLPPGIIFVVIDGRAGHPAMAAERLAATLSARDRQCQRIDAPLAGHREALRREAFPAGTVVLADGPGWRADRGWDIVIWLRPSPEDGGNQADADADIVVELLDPDWPVIRHVAARLAGREHRAGRAGRPARPRSQPGRAACRERAAAVPALRGLAAAHLRRQRAPFPGHRDPPIATRITPGPGPRPTR